jgi:hypothetical protein
MQTYPTKRRGQAHGRFILKLSDQNLPLTQGQDVLNPYHEP